MSSVKSSQSRATGTSPDIVVASLWREEQLEGQRLMCGVDLDLPGDFAARAIA
jgi:hypothetical protein